MGKQLTPKNHVEYGEIISIFERTMISDEKNKSLLTQNTGLTALRDSYNRELSCLVAIEFKVTDFKPEYLGQLEFYLEVLDCDVCKPNEKSERWPDSLRRSLSPALVADYQLRLPNKVLLTEKLRELKELADVENDEDGDE